MKFHVWALEYVNVGSVITDEEQQLSECVQNTAQFCQRWLT
jgi:hypothetical protein